MHLMFGMQFCCVSHHVWYVVLLYQPEGNLSAFKCVISYDVHYKGFKVLQLCKFSWCMLCVICEIKIHTHGWPVWLVTGQAELIFC